MQVPNVHKEERSTCRLLDLNREPVVQENRELRDKLLLRRKCELQARRGGVTAVRGRLTADRVMASAPSGPVVALPTRDHPISFEYAAPVN